MPRPDYRYTPLLATAMASLITFGMYDIVLGSRIIGGTAQTGASPVQVPGELAANDL